MSNNINNMSSARGVAGINEGEIVLIGTEHYKRVGDKLINMSDSSDIREIGTDQSLLGTMIENLSIMKG